jgi:hypothetical protein
VRPSIKRRCRLQEDNQLGLNVDVDAGHLDHVCAALRENQVRFFSSAVSSPRSPGAGAIPLKHPTCQPAHCTQVITNLDLSYNNFAARGCVAIAEALEANGRIKELSLRGNNMGDMGAQRLADTVTKSAKLTKLDVSDNGIGESGGAALGSLIATSRPLKQADLSWNSVRSVGAIAIAEGLKLSPLVRLNLAWNGASSWTCATQLPVQASRTAYTDQHHGGWQAWGSAVQQRSAMP